jgi:glycosyltransferase involved in cell wall biosynthesis
VITTDLPLAAEVVRKHDAGIVVSFDDIQAAADAVRRLANDPQLRQEMGQRGFTAAVEHYNWNQASREFVSLIEDWAAAARQ